jgi:peptidoglycan/xylan/chitin deacetylase (PgdA/CDA1 family)
MRPTRSQRDINDSSAKPFSEPSVLVSPYKLSMTAAVSIDRARRWRGRFELVGRVLWRTPGPFRVARWFGPHYSLRCVLFHHIASSETPFTKGLGVTTSRDDFESALKFLTRHYTPVSLQNVLGEPECHRLPPRSVLVTFDDAYASVYEVAAPLCRKYNLSAVCFVNSSYLDNQLLALDNLVCYAANVIGLPGIAAVACTIIGSRYFEFRSIAEIFSDFLPRISLSAKERFRSGVMALLGAGMPELLAEAQLYLTTAQLRKLAASNFEIGNHTYSHVHGRSMTKEDFETEIDKNKAMLEALTNHTVRAFSVPYGCSEDLTVDLIAHLEHTGHKAAFLAESLPNRPQTNPFSLSRVSIRAGNDAGLFSEIEIMPRVREIRKWLSKA